MSVVVLLTLLAATPDPVWGVLDLLGSARVARPGSLRLHASVLAREAVAGEIDLGLGFLREPSHGFGFALGMDRVLGTEATVGGVRAEGILRRETVRIHAGIRRSTWDSEGVTSLQGGGAVRVTRGVALAAVVDVWPGAGEAVQFGAELAGAQGPWWGWLGLGPRVGELRVRVALEAGPALRPWVGWSGGRVTFAIAAGFGPLELRGAQTRHELLGRVDRVAVSLGGRP